MYVILFSILILFSITNTQTFLKHIYLLYYIINININITYIICVMTCMKVCIQNEIQCIFCIFRLMAHADYLKWPYIAWSIILSLYSISKESHHILDLYFIKICKKKKKIQIPQLCAQLWVGPASAPLRECRARVN